MLVLLLGCVPRTSTVCELLPCNEIVLEDSTVEVDDSSQDSTVEEPAYVAELVDKGLYFETIQEAISEASDGDVVLVQPGTHYENIDFHGKGIHLLSEAGADATVLDGQGAGSVVEIRAMEPETAILQGFTITNGSGTEDHGGGVFVENADPLILHNVVTGNTARIAGGIYMRHGAATVRNNIVVDNIAEQGGGAIVCTNCKGLIEFNTAVGNTAGNGPFAEIFYEPQGDWIANLIVVDQEDAFNAVRFMEPIGYTFDFQHNVLWPDSLPWIEPGNPWYDEWPGDDSNVYGEPVFEDAYRLAEGSPGIDGGPEDVLDADGSRSDVGAYGGPYGDWDPATP